MTCSQPLTNGYEFKFALGFNVYLQEKKVCMIEKQSDQSKSINNFIQESAKAKSKLTSTNFKDQFNVE
jgi:hypothetical protein